MALRYEWCWDFANVGTHSVKVDDDGPAAEITPFSTGTYGHTTIATVDSAYTAFAAALKSALDTASSGAGTYTVTWSGTNGYTISYSAGNFDLIFSTVATPAQGTRMRQLLGMSGDRTGASSYSSQVRPYYLIIPAIAGRSEVSDDYEPDDLVSEVVTDDGSDHQIAPATAEKWSDWLQPGDQDAPATAYTAFGTGVPVHKRLVTSAVPWSYEHAWEHHRTGFDPILVVEGSESLVCRMRAERANFHPRRMGGADFDLWSLEMRMRVLGRL